MKNTDYNTNPWVHTFYISAILLIVLVFVIVLMSREKISDAAMDNVSFAASIVSIVLAVISIVVSVVASFKTYRNLGDTQIVENRINDAITRLKDIDAHILSTDKKVDSLQSILQPTAQSVINSEAEKTVKEITKEEKSAGKGVYTVEDIKILEKKAVERIAREYDLTNLMFDYTVKGHYRHSFDGIARKDDTIWLIDVKLYRPRLLNLMIQSLNRARHDIVLNTGKEPIIVVGLLLTNTSDKQKIQQRLEPEFERNGIIVQFYTFNELNQ